MSGPATGTLRLVVRHDLAAAHTLLDRAVDLAPETETTFEAVWQAPAADLWGCEAEARLLADDGALHGRDRRVFLVTDNVPRAAANQAGISPWLHKSTGDPVAHAFDLWQACAIPLLEVYCWTPSNWGEIYPTTDRWICGQMRYPYSFAQMDHTLEHARRRGMFVMTYARVTYDGAAGYRYVQTHPEAAWYKNATATVPELGEDDLLAWDEAARDPSYGLAQREKLKLWRGPSANFSRVDVLNDGIDQYIRAIRRFGFDGIRWDWHPGSYYDPLSDSMLRGQTRGAVNTMYYDHTGKPLAPDDPDADYLRVVRHTKERFRAALPDLVFGYNIQAWNKSVPDNPDIIQIASHPRAHAEMLRDAVILDEKHFAYANQDGTWGMHTHWTKTAKFWVRGNRLLRRFGTYHYTGGMPNSGSDAFLMHAHSLAYACGARTFGVAVPFERFLTPTGTRPQPSAYRTLLTFAQRYAQYLFHPSARNIAYREGLYGGDWIHVEASRPVVWEEFGQAVTERGAFTMVAHLWNQPLDDLMRLHETEAPPLVESATVTIRQPVGLPWEKAKAYVLSFEWDDWQKAVEVDTSRPDVTVTVPPFRYWAVVMLQYPLEPQPLESR